MICLGCRQAEDLGAASHPGALEKESGHWRRCLAPRDPGPLEAHLAGRAQCGALVERGREELHLVEVHGLEDSVDLDEWFSDYRRHTAEELARP